MSNAIRSGISTTRIDRRKVLHHSAAGLTRGERGTYRNAGLSHHLEPTANAVTGKTGERGSDHGRHGNRFQNSLAKDSTAARGRALSGDQCGVSMASEALTAVTFPQG